MFFGVEVPQTQTGFHRSEVEDFRRRMSARSPPSLGPKYPKADSWAEEIIKQSTQTWEYLYMVPVSGVPAGFLEGGRRGYLEPPYRVLLGAMREPLGPIYSSCFVSWFSVY